MAKVEAASAEASIAAAVVVLDAAFAKPAKAVTAAITVVVFAKIAILD